MSPWRNIDFTRLFSQLVPNRPISFQSVAKIFPTDAAALSGRLHSDSGTSFGTRGSQVQILPLRPTLSRKPNRLRQWLRQIFAGRRGNASTTTYFMRTLSLIAQPCAAAPCSTAPPQQTTCADCTDLLDHLVGRPERSRFRLTGFMEFQLAGGRFYPGLILAARITLPHFSVSSAMNFPN